MSISDFSNKFNISKNKIIDKIHKLGLNSKNLEVFMDAGRRCIVTSTF